MKQGWEIKKLGEVCEVIGGSTPKTSDDAFWDGDYYWISPAELDGSKYVYSTTRTITDAGVKSAHLQILPIGTVLMSSRAPIGKVAITKVPMYCNQGFKNLVCGKDLINEYVFWFLKHNTDYLNSLGTGATFKEISKKIVEQIPIPIPPIAEQEKIVAELDCLSGIIEKKKQQLKELDNLAQSIFYEMFGDPVENDKGWDVKKFGDVANSELGKMLDSKKNQGELYPYLCSANVQWNDVDCTQVKEMRFEEDELERYRVYKGDLLICEGGDTGRCAIWKSDNAIYYQNALHRVRFVDGLMLPIFCLYTMKCYKERGEIDKYSSGQTIKHLVKKVLLTIPLIVPPIALQQDFASKIESIEKQKELIAHSIKETETLFNSRMDYYFN